MTKEEPANGVAQDDQNDNDSTEVEITRVNISMPESFEGDARTIANNHYGGNLSRMFRAAVRDHERTLNDRGLLELERMRTELTSITGALDELYDEVEEVAKATEVVDAQLDSGQQIEDTGRSVDSHARKIRNYLQRTDEPVTRHSIIKDVEVSPPEARSALGKLRDQGLVDRMEGDDEPLFLIASLNGEIER